MKELNADMHEVKVQVKNKDKNKETIAIIDKKSGKKVIVGLRVKVEKQFKLVKVSKPTVKPTKEEK